MNNKLTFFHKNFRIFSSQIKNHDWCQFVAHPLIISSVPVCYSPEISVNFVSINVASSINSIILSPSFVVSLYLSFWLCPRINAIPGFARDSTKRVHIKQQHKHNWSFLSYEITIIEYSFFNERSGSNDERHFLACFACLFLSVCLVAIKLA